MAVLIYGDRTSVATAQAPPAFAGTAPGPGQRGNLITATESTPAGLITALERANCNAAVFALLSVSTQKWSLYVVGAPAFVNAGFPDTLAAETIFFVRCARAGQSYEQWAAAMCAVAQTLTDRTNALIASGSIVVEWGQGGPYDETVYAMIAELAQWYAGFVAPLRDAADQYDAVETPDDLATSVGMLSRAHRDFATAVEEIAALIAAVTSPEQLPALAAWLDEANRAADTAGDAAVNTLPAPARDALTQCLPRTVMVPPVPVPAPAPIATETPAPVPQPAPTETPAPVPIP